MERLYRIVDGDSNQTKGPHTIGYADRLTEVFLLSKGLFNRDRNLQTIEVYTNWPSAHVATLQRSAS